MSILFRPFLVWARENQQPLKVVGDAAARYSRSEDVLYRWGQTLMIGEALARHLDHLAAASRCAHEACGEGSLPDDGPLVAEVLELVNAPVESAAPTNRETRDETWLRRAFDHAARLNHYLTDDAPPPVNAPAPETEVESPPPAESE